MNLCKRKAQVLKTKYKNICIKLGVLNNRKYHRIYNLPTLKSIHFKIAFYSTLYRTEHWSMATDKIVMCFYSLCITSKDLCFVHTWYVFAFFEDIIQATYLNYMLHESSCIVYKTTILTEIHSSVEPYQVQQGRSWRILWQNTGTTFS